MSDSCTVPQKLTVLLSDGTELILFLVAAVFWISYENNVDNTYYF